MSDKKDEWKIGVGRNLVHNGKTMAYVGRVLPNSPEDTDAIAQKIVDLLNGKRSIPVRRRT
jgi:hypothetical protein